MILFHKFGIYAAETAIYSCLNSKYDKIELAAHVSQLCAMHDTHVGEHVSFDT